MYYDIYFFWKVTDKFEHGQGLFPIPKVVSVIQSEQIWPIGQNKINLFLG